MSPFLICVSPLDGQMRQTNERITRTDWTDGFGQTDRQTDWLDGQTDELNKRTYRWKVGRTCARTDGRTDGLGRVYKQTRWTDGREGPDRLDWTDGQDGRTGWTDGLDGRTDWLDGWIGRIDGRTRRMDVSEVDFYNEVGYLYDGVILQLRPESFSFFLSYLNFVNDIEVYSQTQKTMNTWKISGMLIVYWPITIKFRIRKQTSKPQTNCRCCLRFSYLAHYWLISRNTITFLKYFWCSRFGEFHSK